MMINYMIYIYKSVIPEDPNLDPHPHADFVTGQQAQVGQARLLFEQVTA